MHLSISRTPGKLWNKSATYIPENTLLGSWTHCAVIFQRAQRKNVGYFFRSEIGYWHKMILPMPCSLPSVMWLLRRMECAQSVSWCEAAAVFARPATPLRLSHCINSRNSTPKAWKRHTPLGLLQDPENPQIPDQEPERKKNPTRSKCIAVYFLKHFFPNIYTLYAVYIYKTVFYHMKYDQNGPQIN